MSNPRTALSRTGRPAGAATPAAVASAATRRAADHGDFQATLVHDGVSAPVKWRQKDDFTGRDLKPRADYSSVLLEFTCRRPVIVGIPHDPGQGIHHVRFRRGQFDLIAELSERHGASIQRTLR